MNAHIGIVTVKILQVLGNLSTLEMGLSLKKNKSTFVILAHTDQ